LDIKLSPIELAAGKKILADIFQNDQKTIAIFTHATAKKCYSKAWWQSFYERLRSEHPGVNILEILPLNNTSKINFIAPTFYSEDVREIGSVIAHASVFIGADSGIMHLASSVHTSTIGVFSVSNESVYCPYGNGSLGVNTNAVSMDHCFQILHDLLRMETPAKSDDSKQIANLPMSRVG
jgi:ADP-heptose:LPS heptosyltransferase